MYEGKCLQRPEKWRRRVLVSVFKNKNRAVATTGELS